MADPLNPTLITRLRATLGRERDAVLLEAMRSAGRAAYSESMAADQARDHLRAAGSSPWTAPSALTSQLLAAGNAYMLQKLGETFLDTDYAAKPATVGFVPPVTFDQAASWLGSVIGWVSLARQARVNPDFDLGKEQALPAPLPPWAEAQECPPEYLASLRAAIPPVREHTEVAVFTLTRTPAPEDRRPAANRLRQLAAQAEAATTYATTLHTGRHDADLLKLVESSLRHALSLWFHLGQLAAMPRLLTAPSATPPPSPPAT
ncbi:hypothetical protein ODJ79_27220 [Actinoplanes sp. KI2]|uniref:hypothetical protein n=1 Tax=Actinoplanes sp. KI2 TaxID=2983315 RepID=UPI0021D5E187|nr:hypothetical protein [Actinoplanes sp. KI2]MCU7727440.1 hypothetical protein [Actinoplanes sp. KI2]